MPENGPFNTRVFSEDYDFTAQMDARGVSPLALASEVSADTTAGLGIMVENGATRSLTMIVPENLADEMPQAHENLTVERDETTGEMYYTAGSTEDHYMSVIRTRRASLMRKIISQSAAQVSGQAPTVSSADAIERIKAHDPRNILFLGGAGMSAEQIWTFEMISQRAGYDINPAQTADTAQNNAFMRAFIAEPVVAANTIALYNTFTEQKTRATPTRAHYAFSEIMRQLDDQPMAITSNYDRLYDRAGLRVPRIGLAWPETKTSQWGDDAEIVRQLEQRARSISLIVAVGMGGDYKNVVGFVRQENPDATTLGINTASPANLQYLGRSDALLRGDAQVELPRIADALAA